MATEGFAVLPTSVSGNRTLCGLERKSMDSSHLDYVKPWHPGLHRLRKEGLGFLKVSLLL